MGHILDYALPALAAIATTAVTGNPEFGAYAASATSGGLNYSHNHNIGGALGAAAGSYVGSNIGGNLFPAGSGGFGSIGSALGTGSSSDIASALGGGSLGRAIGGAAGTSLGSVFGSVAGNQIGSAAGSQLTPNTPQAPSPYTPVRAGQAGLPTSLNGMSSLTPMQQASGLATQGLYGGGLGPQEQGYFANSINRQLVNDNNQVSSLSSLAPVETSYLGKLGFNQTDPNSLLEALSKWNPSNQSA